MARLLMGLDGWVMEQRGQRAREALQRYYSVEAAAIRIMFAPYRICPLGAHIDHQLGPVTAMAIDQGVSLAYAPSDGQEVRLRSLNFPGEVRFGFGAIGGPQPGDWGNYARGAALALQQTGYELRRGLVGVMEGGWSEGGLSSSAAVGVAYLLALEDANGIVASPAENITLDQRIENGFLGLRNGILDQSGILLSRRDHLTHIDCETARHELIALGGGAPPWRILLAFSGLRQSLVGTDYNRRVSECETAAGVLLTAAGRTSTRDKAVLRDVMAEEYAVYGARLPQPLDRRARHFFSEVERVGLGVEAWRRGDLIEFGRLMTLSGESSIRDYECGCEPMIDLYRRLVECEGVYGARFSGAGFRGCCIGMVDPERAEPIATEVSRGYAERYPELANQAGVVICGSGDGCGG